MTLTITTNPDITTRTAADDAPIVLGSSPTVLTIAYAIEQTDAGWLVWRTLPGREPETVGWLGGRGACPRHRDAVSQVEAAQRADRAAATRLGVTVEHR